MKLFNWTKTKKEKKESAEKNADKIKIESKQKKPAKNKLTTEKVKGKLSPANKDRKLKSMAYRFLIKPHITEKSSILASHSKYIFETAKQANKYSISQAIYDIYNIKPIKVNIINQVGKIVTKGKTSGKRKDWKKAVITLPKGSKIEVYEGV